MYVRNEKMKKTILSIIMSLLAYFSIVSLTVLAEEPSSMIISTASGRPGDTVSVDVVITNNPGINSFTVGFDYDTSRLTLNDVKPNTALGGQFAFSKKAVWINSADTMYSGEILSLTFSILGEAEPGAAYISLLYNDGDICNYNEEDVSFSIEPGWVYVSMDEVVTTNTSTSSTLSSVNEDVTTVSTTKQTTSETSASSKPAEESEDDNSKGNCYRIAGTDRIHTAIAVSESGWDESKNVVLANGYNFPDALVGATLAKKLDAPILLTNSSEINNDVLIEISRLKSKNVYILGGSAAVSENIEKDLIATGCRVERVCGDNRNATATAISREIVQQSESAFLVCNSGFADALSISSVTASKEMPILFINSDGTLPDETREELVRMKCEKAYIIGGSVAIDASAENALLDIGIDSERIYGKDRYETSLSVSQFFEDFLSFDNVVVATGKDFLDALSGASFAAQRGAPVVLINDSASEDFLTAMSVNETKTFYVLGGTSALPDDIMADLEKITSQTNGETSIERKGLLGWLTSCN